MSYYVKMFCLKLKGCCLQVIYKARIPYGSEVRSVSEK